MKPQINKTLHKPMRNTNKSVAGFTLIEILVVVFIVGIVVTAATLTFGDSQADRMKYRSEQIAALIDFAKERAIFNSDELGIHFTDTSYVFYQLQNSTDSDGNSNIEWKVINNDKLLSERTLPDGLVFEVFLEGISIVFDNNEDEIKPHVYIFSDGSITPFEVNITDNIDHSHNLVVAANGDFEFEAVN